MSEDYKSYIKLSLIPEIGPITAMRLIDFFGSPDSVLAASKQELTRVDNVGEKTADSIISNRDKIDVEKICARMNELGAKYIHFNDPRYPKLLKKLSDSPIGFYMIGDCDFSTPCVSIIGSRNCTVYGQLTARKFAAAFSRSGFNVVSGMARGIDSAAHFGAIEGNGKTIAVLGSGADVIYPPENSDLYKKIILNGSIISEFPLGTRADKQNFPIRNRIVAGLSLATIVVESDTRGGSMITARLAAEQGRDVFAVPGRIDQESSRGCHALIRDGATLMTKVEDVIDTLSFSGQIEISFDDKNAKSENKKSETLKIQLAENESLIFEILKSNGELGADAISNLTNLPIATCLPTLLMLEIKKLISKNTGGTWNVRGR